MLMYKLYQRGDEFLDIITDKVIIMIVKSVQEIVLHLESFRNIELYYQGLYIIKLNVYDMPGNNDRVIYKLIQDVVHAHPFAHTENYNPY
jgi:hypothetical protein